MKKTISFASIFIVLTLSSSFGQQTDTLKLQEITYKPNFDIGEKVRVSEQQAKARPFYDEGYYLVGNHEFKKAIVALKKAIEIDPSGNCGTGRNGMAYSELGYSYTRLEDFDNAMIYLNKAIEINKFVPEPYLSKAVILMQQKNNDAALESLNSLIHYIPCHAMGYVQRGFLLDSIEKYELALIDFKKCLELLNEQKQKQNSKALIDHIEKRIEQLERKIKK